MTAMTAGRSPFVRTMTGENRKKPATQLLTLVILALRLVLPYALPVVALSCFVYAGFLVGPVAGFVVLGICLWYLQYLLESTRGD